jgi:hypothetical protein
MRDRVAIAALNLDKISQTDYRLVRKRAIDFFKNQHLTGWLKVALKRSAYQSADDRKAEAVKTHYTYHAGHCAECQAPLIDFVYPLDSQTEFKRGRRTMLEIVRRYACNDHAQRLTTKSYSVKSCAVCGVGFEAFGASGYCSPACRSYDGYQKRRTVLEPRQCTACDAEFVPKRADSVYCSGKCRTASHRRRKL